jgi:uncharacterized RDD family membrane protein YckC
MDHPDRPARRGELLGSWLEGPASVAPGSGWPGQRLGLPQAGVGSVASLGRRIAGTVLDLLIAAGAGGVTLLADPHAGVVTRNLVATGFLLAQWIVLWPTTGQSIGMRLLRIRLLARDGGPPRLRWTLLRALLVIVPVPWATAFTLDGDNRGVQDKASGTVVVNV